MAAAPVLHQLPEVAGKDDQISKVEEGPANADLAINNGDSQRLVKSNSFDRHEKDKAAAKVQATFRGYLVNVSRCMFCSSC